jgi:uncharacterized delta-60 repeat protein
MLFRYLFADRKSRARHGRPAPRRPAPRLSLEPLEDRCVPAAGMLDPTFGQNGLVTTAIGTRDEEIHSLAVQPDGKILAAGATYSSSTSWDFALARYNANGGLDTSFGSGGKAVTVIGNGSDRGNGVALQPDGKIVVAGSTYVRTRGTVQDYDFAVVRYNADGTLDKTFDRDGKVTTSFTSSSTEIELAMALQPDGKILVGGWVKNATQDIAVVRYNTNGSLDTSFGSGGRLSIDIASGSEAAYGLAVQSDGKIVIVGNTWSPATNSNAAFVLRLNSNGTLDSSFGSGGKTLTLLGRELTEADGLALQADGKVVIVGQSYNEGGTGWDIALARFNSDGTLDSTFDGDGLVTIDRVNPNNISEEGKAVAIQADGKILAAGYTAGASSPTTGSDFALVRLNVDGSLDTSFDGDGKVVTPVGTDEDAAFAMALQGDGKVVLGGRSLGGAGYDFALARYLASPPQIGSFTASPNPVAAGSSLALTASGITDGNPSSRITQVAFYYVDTSGTRQLLGTGTEDSAGAWTLTLTVQLAPGTYMLLAQAQDSYGVFSDPVALTLQVL